MVYVSGAWRRAFAVANFHRECNDRVVKGLQFLSHIVSVILPVSYGLCHVL